MGLNPYTRGTIQDEEQPKKNKGQVVKQAHKKWKTTYIKSATDAVKSNYERGFITKDTYDRQKKSIGLIKKE